MKTRHFRRFITVFLLVVGVPSLAFAAGPKWGEDRGPATLRDIIPDPRGGEAYSERYTLFANLEGGGTAYVDLTISNLGWGDRHGATTGEIRLPGQRPYRFKKKLDEDEWSYRRDRFEMKVGPTTISGDAESGFRVRHRGASSFDLTFKSRTPMWSPGIGKLMHDGNVYATTLAVPWGDVTGTIGGKSVNGVGMFDHGMSTFSPFDLADKFSRMRHFEDGLFIAWREVDLTDDLGSRSVTWVIVGIDDKIVFSDSAANIAWTGFDEHEESGHRVPSNVVISASSGGKSLRLEVRGKRVRSTDLLAQHGAAARAVAGAVSNPWQFEVNGSYDLRISGGGTDVSRRGKTNIEMDMLSK